MHPRDTCMYKEYSHCKSGAWSLMHLLLFPWQHDLRIASYHGATVVHSSVLSWWLMLRILDFNWQLPSLTFLFCLVSFDFQLKCEDFLRILWSAVAYIKIFLPIAFTCTIAWYCFPIRLQRYIHPKHPLSACSLSHQSSQCSHHKEH